MSRFSPLRQHAADREESGGDPFESKVEKYAKTGVYLTRSIAELSEIGSSNAITKLNDDLRSWSEWGPDSIRERRTVLYRLSEQIWDV